MEGKIKKYKYKPREIMFSVLAVTVIMLSGTSVFAEESPASDNVLTEAVAEDMLDKAMFAYTNLTVSFSGYDEKQEHMPRNDDFLLVKQGYGSDYI